MIIFHKTDETENLYSWPRSLLILQTKTRAARFNGYFDPRLVFLFKNSPSGISSSLFTAIHLFSI
jgi:hypothetical protein